MEYTNNNLVYTGYRDETKKTSKSKKAHWQENNHAHGQKLKQGAAP